MSQCTADRRKSKPACVAEVVYDKDVLSFRIAFCNPDYSLLSFANFAAEEDLTRDPIPGNHSARRNADGRGRDRIASLFKESAEALFGSLVWEGHRNSLQTTL